MAVVLIHKRHRRTHTCTYDMRLQNRA